MYSIFYANRNLGIIPSIAIVYSRSKFLTAAIILIVRIYFVEHLFLQSEFSTFIVGFNL